MLGVGFGLAPAAPPPGICEAAIAAMNPVALYSFADRTSLFVGLDGSGGNPAVGGSTSIGVVLDKAQMGGRTAAAFVAAQPELVINGTFAADTAGWTGQSDAALSVAGGALRVTRSATAGTFPRAEQTLANLVVGRTYLMTGTVRGLSLSGGAARFDTAANATTVAVATATAPTTFTLVFRAISTVHTLRAGISPGASNVGDWVEYDDISLKELPGNHALAPADNQRPVLAAAEGRLVARHDGVDDVLRPAFGSGLGADTYLALALASGDATGVVATSGGDAAGVWDATAGAPGGTPSVNGGGPLATRSALKAAIGGAAAPVVVEVTGVPWSGLTGCSPLYDPAVPARNVAGDLYGLLVLPATPDAEQRALIRRWLAGLAGSATR